MLFPWINVWKGAGRFNPQFQENKILLSELLNKFKWTGSVKDEDRWDWHLITADVLERTEELVTPMSFTWRLNINLATPHSTVWKILRSHLSKHAHLIQTQNNLCITSCKHCHLMPCKSERSYKLLEGVNESWRMKTWFLWSSRVLF